MVRKDVWILLFPEFCFILHDKAFYIAEIKANVSIDVQIFSIYEIILTSSTNWKWLLHWKFVIDGICNRWSRLWMPYKTIVFECYQI